MVSVRISIFNRLQTDASCLLGGPRFVGRPPTCFRIYTPAARQNLRQPAQTFDQDFDIIVVVVVDDIAAAADCIQLCKYLTRFASLAPPLINARGTTGKQKKVR